MTTRHFLIARAGAAPGSRYAVLVGLVVEDPTARARHERISTIVDNVDDVGRLVSYVGGFFNDLVRLSLRD